MWWHRFGSATATRSARCCHSALANRVRLFGSTLKPHSVSQQVVIASRKENFAQFVQALRIFHATEGHFNVPLHFVVPSHGDESDHRGSDAKVASPWPQEFHGMKLGYKLLYLVKKMDPNNFAPQREEKLREIGFPPLQVYPEYYFTTTFFPALQTFQTLFGDLCIPPKFVVPYGDVQWPRPTWQLPLGVQLDKFRRRPDQLTDDQLQRLHQLQVVMDVAGARYQRMVANRKKALQAKWQQEFLPCLKQYHAIHGHTSVPRAFVVPSGNEVDRSAWPKEMHGIRLGHYVTMIRDGKYAQFVQAHKQELDDLQFAIEPWQSKWEKWNGQIMPCLELFVQQFGHLDVPQRFVVPRESPWPRHLWDFQLGMHVKNIRIGGSFADQVEQEKEKLQQLGFVWSAEDRVGKTVDEVVLPSVELFRQLNGHLVVQRTFVVPNTQPWPLRARNFPLGDWITRLRCNQIRMDAATREKVHQSGIHLPFADLRYLELLLPAFEAFASENGGDCESMSTNFVVPERAPYPKQTWGIKLGGALWHIRNGDTYVKDPRRVERFRELKVLIE